MSAAVTAWTPLRRSTFATMWTALVTIQIVSWMHTVGAATLIEQNHGSAAEIALVQTALSIPTVAFGVFGGAAADVIGSRRLMVCAEAWAVCVLVVLALLTIMGVVTPLLALLFTVALGTGTAFSNPAFQSLIPGMVSKIELPAAVALTSVAINIARVVGPAVAGLLIAAVGAGYLFFTEAALLFFAVALIVRTRVKSPPRAPEGLFAALRLGLRYVRYSPGMRTILASMALFLTFGSALLALMPVVALRRLELSPFELGVLYACLGGGAIFGLNLQPRLRARYSIDTIVTGGSVVVAAAYLVLAFVGPPVLVALALVPCGAAWTNIMSTQATSAQQAVPSWVRARALSIFFSASASVMALGGAFWGVVTERAGVGTALAVASAGMLLALAGRLRWSLVRAVSVDVEPVAREPVDGSTSAPAGRGPDGPVVVAFEYRVPTQRWEEFLTAINDVGQLRRRLGAAEWTIYQDVHDVDLFVETYTMRSRADQLRQAERFTAADTELCEWVREFLVGNGLPDGPRFLASPRDGARARWLRGRAGSKDSP